LTQVWDRTDEFDTSPSFGDRVLGYLPVVPSSSFTYGRLCDFDGDGEPYANGLDGAAPDAPVAFVWREQSLTSQEAELWSYNSATFLPSTSITTGRFGVLARCQNGTLAGTSSQNIRLGSADCYAFTLESAYPSTTVTFKVSRFNSGTETVLQTIGFSAAAPLNIDLGKPVGMLIRVVDSGGNPVITSTITNITLGSAQFTGVVLFTPYTDSSGSKLTGAGWPGFICGQDRNDISLGGPLTADIKHKLASFEVTDGSGTILHRDEWQRAFPTLSLQGTDDFGQAGACVQSVMVGDLYGASSYANTFLEAGTNTTDAAEYNPASGSQTLKYCPSQRAADDNYRAAPEVEFDFSATGSGATAMGVIARAQGTHTGTTDWTGVKGYLLLLEYTGSAFSLELYRLEGTQDVLLASMTPSVGLGTQTTLGLKCQPVSNTFLSGPVELTAYIGGVQQTLVIATPNPTGVTVAGGIVTDSSTSRIQQGFGEALAFDTSSTRRITLYTWDEGSYAAGVLPPEDQASIVFAGEGSSGATLTVNLASPIQVASDWYTARTKFDSGHTKARATKSQGRKVWPSLQTIALSTSERDSLLAFWRAREGGVEPFTWTNPQDETAYVVRFMPGSYREAEQFLGVWTVQFGLEEVL